MRKGKDKELCRIEVILTESEILVTYSDWLQVNPRKLDRVRDIMGKAWRRERAKVMHEDRIRKAKEAKAKEAEEKSQEVV